MNYQRSFVYKLYNKVFGIQLYKDDKELNKMAQFLYRRVLKHVHLSYKRDITRISKIEEFKWIFTKIEEEPNVMKKYEMLRSVDLSKLISY